MKWLLISLFLIPLWALSYETDQYSVPPRALIDIGEDFSRFIYQHLEGGLEEMNQSLQKLPKEIEELEKNIASFPVDLSSLIWTEHPQRSEFLQIKQDLEEKKALLKNLQTPLGRIAFLHQKYSMKITWNEQRDGVFGASLSYISQNRQTPYDQIYFNHPKLKTIYSFSGFHRLISPSYFVFASTVKAYGIYMGVDKFGHFINQGFEYFEKYTQALKQGKSSDQAYQEMIQWGKETEEGLFGALVDGVYSNGDLAANFAGFIFYQNFFNDLEISGERFPKILRQNAQGLWVLNSEKENFEKNILKRFFSDHWDESLNASVYERPQRFFIKKALESRCETWKNFYNLTTSTDYNRRTEKLNLWKGFPYGHQSEGQIPVSSLCFKD